MTVCQLRTLRAAVFATLCVAVSATAHFSMSGAELSAPALVAAFAGTAGGTWLLAGRRRGLPAVTLWMVTAQSALHLLFESTAVAQAPRSAPDWAGLLLCTPKGGTAGMTPAALARMAGLDPDAPSAGGAMGQMPAMPGMQGMAGMRGGATAMPLGLSPGMLAAHLVAALLCAVVLWRGEAAIAGVFELLRVLAAVFLPVLLLLAPHGPGRVPTVRRRPTRDRLPRLVSLSHVLSRRGPPPFALAA
ncbi:hypothetical protein GCM10009738_16130 [Kitasatospora viridis]|uniref:hypothetical protein n=1 Tax=Kitasatospora viridis TaxID=281105 RepID=UPI0031D92097